MASTQGSTSPASGTILVAGVSRSGSASTTPALPTVSGMPPRFEPMTGIPLIMASMATSGWFSHQSEGMRAIFVSPQNRRGSVVWVMI